MEEALREVTGPTREETGCLSFHTFQSVRDQRLFFIHSRWVDEAALQAHAQLPHTIRFLKRMDALLDQPLDVTRTERLSELGCREAKQGYERSGTAPFGKLRAGRNGCDAKEKSPDPWAVEKYGERTTTGVVGRARLHNLSRKSR